MKAAQDTLLLDAVVPASLDSINGFQITFISGYGDSCTTHIYFKVAQDDSNWRSGTIRECQGWIPEEYHNRKMDTLNNTILFLIFAVAILGSLAVYAFLRLWNR